MLPQTLNASADNECMLVCTEAIYHEFLYREAMGNG